MDGQRFDDFARGFATLASRRSFARGALAGIGALVGALATPATGFAACRSAGRNCNGNGNCCSRIRGDKNATGRRVCVCPPG